MFVRSVVKKDRNSPEARLTTKSIAMVVCVFLWAEDLINLVAALFCCQLLDSIPFLSCQGSLNKTDCDAKL